jgi:hypothetical protein
MPYKVILKGDGQMLFATDRDLTNEETESLRQRFLQWKVSGMPIGVMGGISGIIDDRPVEEQGLKRIFTRDRSSGRYHTRYVENVKGRGRRLVDERCNLDQAGKYDIVDEIPASADANTLCRHCFGAPDA